MNISRIRIISVPDISSDRPALLPSVLYFPQCPGVPLQSRTCHDLLGDGSDAQRALKNYTTVEFTPFQSTKLHVCFGGKMGFRCRQRRECVSVNTSVVPEAEAWC